MKIKKRPCRNCHSPFEPNKFNHHKQQYCCKSECKRIANREKRTKYRNTKKWDLEFRADEVKRVQKWRLKHPGYSQKKAKTDGSAESSLSENKDSNFDFPRMSKEVDVLRDLVIRQELILVGMASQFVGDLPENVESFLLNCGSTGRLFTPFSDSANKLFSSSEIFLDKKMKKIWKKSPQAPGLRDLAQGEKEPLQDLAFP